MTCKSYWRWGGGSMCCSSNIMPLIRTAGGLYICLHCMAVLMVGMQLPLASCTEVKWESPTHTPLRLPVALLFCLGPSFQSQLHSNQKQNKTKQNKKKRKKRKKLRAYYIVYLQLKSSLLLISLLLRVCANHTAIFRRNCVTNKKRGLKFALAVNGIRWTQICLSQKLFRNSLDFSQFFMWQMQLESNISKKRIKKQ